MRSASSAHTVQTAAISTNTAFTALSFSPACSARRRHSAAYSRKRAAPSCITHFIWLLRFHFPNLEPLIGVPVQICCRRGTIWSRTRFGPAAASLGEMQTIFCQTGKLPTEPCRPFGQRGGGYASGERVRASSARLLRMSPVPQGPRPTLLVVRAQRRRGSPVPCLSLPGVPCPVQRRPRLKISCIA